MTNFLSDLYWAGVIGLGILAFLAFWGGLGYVIVHFIAKYW